MLFRQLFYRCRTVQNNQSKTPFHQHPRTCRVDPDPEDRPLTFLMGPRKTRNVCRAFTSRPCGGPGPADRGRPQTGVHILNETPSCSLWDSEPQRCMFAGDTHRWYRDWSGWGVRAGAGQGKGDTDRKWRLVSAGQQLSHYKSHEGRSLLLKTRSRSEHCSPASTLTGFSWQKMKRKKKQTAPRLLHEDVVIKRGKDSVRVYLKPHKILLLSRSI